MGDVKKIDFEIIFASSGTVVTDVKVILEIIFNVDVEIVTALLK